MNEPLFPSTSATNAQSCIQDQWSQKILKTVVQPSLCAWTSSCLRKGEGYNCIYGYVQRPGTFFALKCRPLTTHLSNGETLLTIGGGGNTGYPSPLGNPLPLPLGESPSPPPKVVIRGPPHPVVPFPT